MNPTENAVRVRFAPSPTGPFHLGGARTALFNLLFARKYGGKFILRIEDTDKERSAKEYEDQIIESLSWLNLDWDEGPDREGDFGPYRQSERGEIYKSFLETLLKEGKAYYCYCTKEELEAQKNAQTLEGIAPHYSGHCRNLKEPPAGKSPQVIRFKMPDVEVEFKDMIRGSVKFKSSLFGDIAIAKDLENPLYNFSVVVDDHLMQISHVIRGEDHLSNTPKQIVMAKAMGFKEPIFAHLPLILAPDKSKLSKRYAEVSLLTYREKGYLPEAIDNFLALLGWHPSDNREIFSLEELIKEFDIKRVQKAGAVFNEEKLNWLNGEHLKRIPDEDLVEIIASDLKNKGIDSDKNLILKILSVIKERMKTTGDFWSFADFFFKLPDYEPALLAWQSDNQEKTRSILQRSKEKIINLPEDPPRELILEYLEELIAENGRGSVLWPLRVALSGKSASPDPTLIVKVLGGKESSDRIDVALKKLE